MRKFLLAGVSLAGMCAAAGTAKAQQDPATGIEISAIGGGADESEVALAASTAGQSTAAGEANADPRAAEDGRLAGQQGFGDIVVTAQRQAESSQRAAIALDVVGGPELTESGVTNTVELSRFVPALTIQTIGGSSTAFIRGVGNFTTFQSADAAIAFNYDGVYLGRPIASTSTFFDLERVEVLKGPQGTLYGRNATAGAINVVPVRPQFDEVAGYFTAAYGNYDDFNAEGAINVPTGDTSAFRISAAITNRDGYLSDGSADSETEAVRAQFLAELTPDLSVRLAADYIHLGGTGTGLTFLERQSINIITGAYTVTPTGISRSEGTGSPLSQAFWTSLPTGGLGAPVAIPPGIPGRNRDPFPELFRDNELYGVNAEIVYDTGSGVLTIIPAARWDHLRGRSPTAGFPIYNNQEDSQLSLEARFAGSAGPIDYTLGAFYYQEDILVRAGTLVFGTTINFQEPQDVSTESVAAFARIVGNVTEQLRLVGGLRYTHDSKQIDATVRSISVGCEPGFTCPDAVLPTSVLGVNDLPFTVPPPGTTAPGPTPGSIIETDPLFMIDERLSDGRFTWRAAVEFDAAPDSLLYASIETGFRAGGFNIAQGFETYEPETITAYTIGSKNRFLDNRLQLNFEAFYWSYRNQQVAHPGVDLAFRPTSITENIGRSTIKGIEVDARALVTDRTVLSATVAYLDSENEEFVYTVPSPLRPLTNCAISPNATRPGFFDVDCAGLPGYNAPEWTVNLAAEQSIPVGDYEIVLNADTQFKSSRYLGFEYQPQMLQDSSWTSNARISFGPANGQWSIAAYVRNIENDRLLLAPLAFGGLLVAYTTPPRTYGLRATVRF